jgi:hypothetical protein
MTTRRMARAAGVLFLGAVVLAIGYLLFGIGPHPIDWYRLDTADSMTVELTTGPNPWVWVTGVTETPTSVAVIVKVFDLRLGPGTAAGYAYDAPIRLTQPLGSRIVYDGTGQEVPEYHAPQP